MLRVNDNLAGRMVRLLLLALLGVGCILLGYVSSVLVNMTAPSGQSSSFFLLVGAGGVALVALLIIIFTNSRLGLEITLLAIVAVLARANMQIALVDGSLLVATAVDVLSLLALLVITAHYVLNMKQGSAGLLGLGTPLLAFVLVGVIGTFIALVRDVPWVNIAIEVKGFYFSILVAPIAVYTINSLRQLTRVMTVVALAASFTALTAVQQAAQGGGLDSWLGNGIIIQRASGIYSLVNQYAFLVMAALLVLVGLLFYWGWHIYSLLLAPFAALLATGLVLSFSRGAYIGCAVGLAVLLLTIGRGRLVAIVLLALLAIPFLPDTVVQRMELHDNSLDARLDYWNIGTSMVGAYPIFGAGWGAVVLFNEGQKTTAPGQIPWWHDDYLNIASQIGLVGLASFLAIWLKLAALVRGQLGTLGSSRLRPLIAALAAAVAAMLTQAATDHFFWRAETAPFIWLIVGLLLAAINIARKEANLEREG